MSHKSRLSLRHRENGEIQFLEFRIGKRIDDKFDVPAGQIGGQLRQKLCIGAGDSTAVEVHPKGIDAFFPAFYFLDFIKNRYIFPLLLSFP